jgi:hypothetical protein
MRQDVGSSTANWLTDGRGSRERVMSHEDEEKREAFIAASQGVKMDALGQFWRYSSYASGSIPGWHPAMIGRWRRSHTTGQDVVNAVLFMLILFGTPGIALFTHGVLRLPLTLGYLAVVVAWIVVAHTVAVRRSRPAMPHPFPHPGEKGHHVHTS